nr:FeoA family protein [Maliibacterium massiliense]
MTLDAMKIGQEGTIAVVGGAGALRRRLLDMGLTPRTRVLVRKVAPMGDPIEIKLRGYELTLRRDDAQKIQVTGVK